jgi:hypothetical protein
MNWEYTTEIGTFEGTNELLQRLNKLGAEGWEAVGIAAEPEGEHDTGYTVLLKRVKKPEAGPVTW